MTLKEAFALLKEKRPQESFSIHMEAWHHARVVEVASEDTAEWTVYSIVDRRHHYGKTLEEAMRAFLGLGPDDPLLDAQRSLEQFPDGSGYEIKGRLEQ